MARPHERAAAATGDAYMLRNNRDESQLRLNQGVNAVDVSADQQVLALGGNTHLVLAKVARGYQRLELEDQHFLKEVVLDKQRLALMPALKVKFNPTLSLAHLLATGSSGGALFVWNIEHSKSSLGHWKPDSILKEHSQAVSSISWHSSNPHTLLTGSNDTKIKLWDLRVRTRSTLSINPRSSAVRDVEFRKVEGSHRFAAAFGNGTVQVWDVRHPKKAEAQFKAHEMAYTVAWNPEMPNLLASGGRDGLVKIWDPLQPTASAQDAGAAAAVAAAAAPGPGGRRAKRKKQQHLVQTITTTEKGVARVRWRPDHPYQIASIPLRGPEIQVWDILEPTVPLACVKACDDSDVATGFVWLDQFLLASDVVGSSLHWTPWWEDEEEPDDTRPEDAFSDGQQHQHQHQHQQHGGATAAGRAGDIDSASNNGGSGAGPSNLFVRIPSAENNQGDSRDSVSVSESIDSRETSNYGQGDAADSESLARRREQQRQRFRQHKHRHRTDADCQQSWGLIVSCSKTGQVRLASLADSFKPLEKHRATSMSLSCLSRLVVIHDEISETRTSKALLRNREVTGDERAPRPRTEARLCLSDRLRTHGGNVRPVSAAAAAAATAAAAAAATAAAAAAAAAADPAAMDRRGAFAGIGETFIASDSDLTSLAAAYVPTYAAAQFGFDAEQFKVLARAYITPTTLFEATGEGTRRAPAGWPGDDDDDDPAATDPDADTFLKFTARGPEDIALCCSHNARAADAVSAPALAQVWRLIKLLFVPECVEDHLDSALLRDGASLRPMAAPVDPWVADSDGIGQSDGLPKSSRGTERSIASAGSARKRPTSPLSPVRVQRQLSADHTPPPSPSSAGSAVDGEYWITKGVRPPVRLVRSNSVASDPARLADDVQVVSLGGHRVRKSMDALESKSMGPAEETEAASVAPRPVSAASMRNTRDRVGELANGSTVSDETMLVPAPPPATRAAKLMAVADPFPMDPAVHGLWLGTSLNLLCRLGSIDPLDEAQFNVHSQVLEQDQRELSEALAIAKPLPDMHPVPSGQRKFRKEQRRMRRQRFVAFKEALYMQQLAAYREGVPRAAPGVSSSPKSPAPPALVPLDPPIAPSSAATGGTAAAGAGAAAAAATGETAAAGEAGAVPTRSSGPSGDNGTTNNALVQRDGANPDGADVRAEGPDLRSAGGGGAASAGGGAVGSGGGGGGGGNSPGAATSSMLSEALLQSPSAGVTASLGVAPETPAGVNGSALVSGNIRGIASGLVHDVLRHHAESGDVQTCVMVMLVLGSALDPPVETKLRRMWLCSYIDLLQQLQVFSVAARIIRSCGDQKVEQWYQMTNMVAEGCNVCALENRKNVIRANPAFRGKCVTCRSSVSRCSVCETLVKGVFVWCQGCGHGGHLDHLTDWFRNESLCPTGCGHTCNFGSAARRE